MDISCCFIKEKFFLDHADFQKMLDPGHTEKQAKRSHLCVKIATNGKDYYLPLRNHLGDEIRAFGRIGHAVPSSTRLKAGLDYRYALLIQDKSYIETANIPKIPNSQARKLSADYAEITLEFARYLEGFKKAAKKHRIEREPLYRESSLINFISEL